MLERFVILVAAVIVAGAAAWLWQRWRERQLNGARADDIAAASSVPTVLYFTADWCGQCRLQQRPIIDRLLSSMHECFKLREIDVASETELANRFRVVTLPTTVVVAPSGRVVARNTGVTQDTTLNMQIQQALPKAGC